VLAIAALSALVSAGAALIETDLKRIIAYSTVSQIAFIFLGFAVGNEVGVVGALLYILMHGLAKGGLFLCAGIVEQNSGTKDITKLGGLFRTMPVTSVAFLFCAFSVMGVPPFGGFFSKYLVISGAVQSGKLWLAFVFLAVAMLTLLYLLRIVNMVFFGAPRGSPAREGSRTMVASVAALAFLSVAAGVFIRPCFQVAQAAAHQMLGAPR
jgi:formate hydrogenlyase subunit 3/multisubunit Na+/H+ antiporter MnhD subunit